MCSDGRWGDQNPQLLILSPETLCAQNCLWCELLHCLAEKRYSFCHIRQVFKKLCQMAVWMHGLRKKFVEVIVVALIIHHTPSLTFCNGILWINMVLSADQFVLFWEVTYSVRWNKASLLNRITVGSVSTAYMPWMYSSWTTVLLYGCKCSSFVMICVRDRHTHNFI